MPEWPEGTAIVYCEGSFNTPNGKTAHGLIRFTRRYRVHSVIDSRYSGQDAGKILDDKPNGILIYENVEKALEASRRDGPAATHLVIGLAPDGGRLNQPAREDIKKAIGIGLNVDSGLHDFLSEDENIARLAGEKNVKIRDVRMPPPRNQLHFFSGKIEEVTSPLSLRLPP